MSVLPYFKWFPADAESDEKYASMTDQELGFYHRCLNKSWINGGLPADQAELSRLLKVTPAYLGKVWPRVSQCFTPMDDSGARLGNPRQERERENATKTSDNNKRPGNANAKRTRPERNANDTPRALAGADSGYESVSESKKQELRNLREMPKSDFHVRYESLYASHPVTGFRADGQLRYLEILSAAVSPDVAADAIDRNHAEYRAFWDAHPAEFRPGIGKYFEDGWYLRKPQPKARDSPPSRLSPTQQALAQARAEKEQNAGSRQSH